MESLAGLKLIGNGLSLGVSRMEGRIVAEGTAARGEASVPVGAGKTSVDGEPLQAPAVPFPVVKKVKRVHCLSVFAGLRIMKTTAPIQTATPIPILTVKGSPNRSVPIIIAVRGSNTPSMEVFVGPI